MSEKCRSAYWTGSIDYDEQQAIPRRLVPGDGALSLREIQVLQLVAIGRSNKRVAAELSITEDTVKAHMCSILGKLVANDRTHAVTIALQRGIIIV